MTQSFVLIIPLFSYLKGKLNTIKNLLLIINDKSNRNFLSFWSVVESFLKIDLSNFDLMFKGNLVYFL